MLRSSFRQAETDQDGRPMGRCRQTSVAGLSRTRPATSTGTSWSRDPSACVIDAKAWTFRRAPADIIPARPKVTPTSIIGTPRQQHTPAGGTAHSSQHASATLASPLPTTASAGPASASSRRTAWAAAHLCPPGAAAASQLPPLPVPSSPGQPRPPRGARLGGLSANLGEPAASGSFGVSLQYGRCTYRPVPVMVNGAVRGRK